MILKDETRFVPLNWNSPFSSLQFWREPITLNTALMASSCCRELAQISRLMSDTPRARPTDAGDSPSPPPPLPVILALSLAVVTRGTSSASKADARPLRTAAGRFANPFPLAPAESSPAGVVRRRTATRSLESDDSRAVTPRTRDMVVLSDGASPATVSLLRRVAALVPPGRSTCRRSRTTRG